MRSPSGVDSCRGEVSFPLSQPASSQCVCLPRLGPTPTAHAAHAADGSAPRSVVAAKVRALQRVSLVEPGSVHFIFLIKCTFLVNPVYCPSLSRPLEYIQCVGEGQAATYWRQTARPGPPVEGLRRLD